MRAGTGFSLRRTGRAYTLIEMCVTLLVIQMIGAMVVVNISSVEGAERVERSAQETLVALRYARTLAMSTGQPCGVEFDIVNQRVRVFQGAAATTVTNPLMGNAAHNYVFELASKQSIRGVRIHGVLMSNAPASPYRCVFGKLGGTINNGFVIFRYGQATKTVVIPLVGEPRVQ